MLFEKEKIAKQLERLVELRLTTGEVNTPIRKVPRVVYNDPVAEVGVQVESDSVSQHVRLQPQGGGQGVAQAWAGGVVGYSVQCTVCMWAWAGGVIG